MIVFTVYEHNYSASQICGVWKTYKAAQAYIDQLDVPERYKINFDIDEWTVLE